MQNDASMPAGRGIDRRSALLGGGAVAVASLAGLGTSAAAATRPPKLTFTGPVPVTASSKPWGSAMDGGPREKLIRMYDYVEEEYFISGTAGVYGPGRQDGNAARAPELGRHGIELTSRLRPLAALVRPDVPFRTRVLVLKPRDPTKFSGNVHLVPLHNLDGTTYVERNLLRGGDVWMGLEVNGGTRFGVEERPSGGVVNLRETNPERYSTLSLPAGLPADWPDLQPGRLAEAFKKLNFMSPDGETFIFTQEISRSYAQAPDIITNTAGVLRSNPPVGPLTGYRVRRMYTAGRSGQTTILAPYIDFHHDRAVTSLGHVPFDGYMIRVGAMPASRPRGSVLVLVQTEGEAVNLKPPLPSDSDNPKVRYYEIPGAGHGISSRPNISHRIGSVVPQGVQGISDIEGHTDYQPFDKINLPIVWGMWRNIYEWVDKGVPMPRAAPITRDASAPDGIARDRFGNALGGLRTPWVDVPDAVYVGQISKKNSLEGGMKPFARERMTELYGSDAAYRARIDARLEQMARDRWIAGEDMGLMRHRGVSPALALGLAE